MSQGDEKVLNILGVLKGLFAKKGDKVTRNLLDNGKILFILFFRYKPRVHIGKDDFLEKKEALIEVRLNEEA